jgi:putative hemolysin
LKAATLTIALTLPLTACAGPSIEAFNDRGGVISYHMVNSSMADVLAVAERYCAGIGRKAKLGTPSMGMTSMNVSFECVE